MIIGVSLDRMALVFILEEVPVIFGCITILFIRKESVEFEVEGVDSGW